MYRDNYATALVCHLVFGYLGSMDSIRCSCTNGLDSTFGVCLSIEPMLISLAVSVLYA